MKTVLTGLIGIYQRVISPLLPRSCRFYPTCSEYSKQAIIKHGALKGSFVSLKRIVKCNPWHPGGIDHVK
ncbi:MAG TPA: membrane protein insertion efficiency factor YidD [bacterium]|nr:membrane protein insertion efficiency factor YidD [bacterium]